MRFSRRTLDALAQLLSAINTHTTIESLAYRLGLERSATGDNKLGRCLSLVKTVEGECIKAGDDKRLVDLMKGTLDELTEWQIQNLDVVSGLSASLKMDGFEFVNGGLIPTSPEPVALAPQISILEQQLVNSGLDIAANHYGQACENLVSGNFEAANSQIRSYLESLFIKCCEKCAGKSFGDPNASIQHLKDGNFLDPSEWNMLRGFWSMCNTNGPHAGQSNSEESIFRISVATAIGRYMLHRFYSS
jgi:hypothetical protein